MSALRPSLLVGALIAIAAFSSCSDSENGSPANGVDAAAGEANAAGEGGAAGVESTAGGGPAMSAGADAGPGPVGPGPAGAAGQDSAGGASAGAGPDASAGAGMVAPEQLTFCPRLTTPSVNAFDVTRAYDHAVYDDCRVTWVTNLYLVVNAREDFLNNLLSWSLRFWGCQSPAVDDFALIYQKAPLTSADAAALIDDYIVVATAELTLSTQESSDMRAALTRLAQQTIAQDSADYSNSTCGGPGGTGGPGGAGGAGDTGGIGGSGGASASSGSGTGGSGGTGGSTL